ncbi:MAG: CopG family transcriptional regulator [bacterium]
MSGKSYSNISIQTDYYQEIEKIIAQSGQFQSVSDYVNYVLKELLFGEGEKTLSEDEEEHIKKRLHDLGYL